MEKERIELCCHTKMSNLQGIADVGDYMLVADKRGYSGIAFTDVNSVQAFMHASESIGIYADDIKIIYGAEMYFKEDIKDKELYKVYVYVQKQAGLKNLYKLISIANNNVDNDKHPLLKRDLDKYRKGLLYASIGNEGEVYKKIKSKNIQDIVDYYDFLGINPLNCSKTINKKINEICLNKGKILVGTTECNYINKDDFKCNEVLNKYKKVSNITQGNGYYFKTTEELINDFNYLENAEEIVTTNTIRIKDQIEEINVINESGHFPIIEKADDVITKECYKKAESIYGKNLPKKIKDRIDLEIKYIIAQKCQSMFLIYKNLVEYSKSLGYKTGFRGGIGNSLVAYLLEITDVDPIKYGLSFEIFAGKKYDREPDIALNFSERIRNKIFEYLQKKFGKNKVIRCGCAGTIMPHFNNKLEKCIDEYLSGKNKNEKDELYEKLDGIKWKTGEHPGAVFVFPKDLDVMDFTPTEIGDGGHLKTHFDYHDLDESGILKLNIIGVDSLTVIHDLEEETNENSEDIDLEDKSTIDFFNNQMDSFKDLQELGIPFFDDDNAKELIELGKPNNFNDLVCIDLLTRGSNTWTDYERHLVKNKNIKIDELVSNRDDLYKMLKETELDDKVAFNITKFISLGKQYRKLDQWYEYSKKMKYTDVYAVLPTWFLDSVEKIKYLFPKAHGIEYMSIAFKIAWYKVHHEEIFNKTVGRIKNVNTLIELSKEVLENTQILDIKEDMFSNLSKLEEIREYLEKEKNRKRIVILGMNPAEHDKKIKINQYKEYDGKHLEYVANITPENQKKIRNLTNVKYFKAHYDLFDDKDVQMSWPIIKECQKTISDLKIATNEKPDSKKTLLIFGDLIYYHHTKQKDIENIIDEKEKNEEDDLHSTVKKIVEEHIRMFNPDLILVTNSYASKLIWRAYNGNENYSDDVICYKTSDNKKTKILLAGMISGQRAADVFSKIRLKKRIKEELNKKI